MKLINFSWDHVGSQFKAQTHLPRHSQNPRLRLLQGPEDWSQNIKKSKFKQAWTEGAVLWLMTLYEIFGT